MSLNSLASNRVALTLKKEGAAAKPLSASGEDTLPAGIDPANALSALVEYIPTESVSLYLATLAALPAIRVDYPGLTAERAYWSFLILTPLLFIVIFLGKRKNAGKGGWPGWQEWPFWPLFATTAAFAAWGVAVPESAYFTGTGGQALSAVLALFVSIFLGILGRWLGPVQE